MIPALDLNNLPPDSESEGQVEDDKKSIMKEEVDNNDLFFEQELGECGFNTQGMNAFH